MLFAGMTIEVARDRQGAWDSRRRVYARLIADLVVLNL